MNVVKPSGILVYDNLYAKPPLLGPHQRFSMVVLFCVEGIIYYGQLEYETGMWETTPGDEKKRQFKDRVVEYWFHLPNTIDLFKNYAVDVHSKKCLDEVSRLDEYK
jgi:hypothetical protein